MSFTDRTRRGETAGTFPAYPMMLRSAASPGSVGSVGRRWHIVASSYRCQTSADPLCVISGCDEPLPRGGEAPCSRKQKRRPEGGVFVFPDQPDYLILVSLNSTCFFATGSYLRKDS